MAKNNFKTLHRIKIGASAPDFSLKAFHNGEFKNIQLKDYKGKWVVLAFYPADFTFICPTELSKFADYYEDFKNSGAEIMSVSTDTEHAHKTWWDNSQSIRKIKFPMLADPTGKMCKDYGTYINTGDDEGRSLRASIIIDPDGIVKSIDMHDNSVGRSVKEVLRKLKAAKYVKEHGGEVCPVEWEAGQSTLKPGVDLVGKI
jgi:peroxiredoxin (alkyl hydroperoxide reductase subunit C)